MENDNDDVSFSWRYVFAGGIAFPTCLVGFAVFGTGDTGVKSIFFFFGVALFIAAVLMLYYGYKKLEQYRTVAITDPLTGLLNRQGKEKAFSRLFSTDFREDRARHVSRRIELAVIYIDVDGFKQLNDTAGHAAGDRALVAIARIIQRAFKRAGDIVVREGGDEFIVILPYTGTVEAEKHAESLLLAANASDDLLQIKAQYGILLTLSIGVASGSIETDKSWAHAQDILKVASEYADKVMYESKYAGGNRARVWGPVN